MADGRATSGPRITPHPQKLIYSKIDTLATHHTHTQHLAHSVLVHFAREWLLADEPLARAGRAAPLVVDGEPRLLRAVVLRCSNHTRTVDISDAGPHVMIRNETSRAIQQMQTE